MSAGASARTIAADGRLWMRSPLRATTASAVGERPWIRLVTFGALAAYGVERWATLMPPAPGWRLAGLVILAVVIAGAVPPVARRSRPAAALMGFLLMPVAFPLSGLRWHWFTHLRVAVSAHRIELGLQALPNVLVPYLGTSHAVRLVIVLGAAVLLLDAAAVLAFVGRAEPSFGDGRRAAAALPLVALAIVPATLVRPQLPYLQGLLLFILLAAFMWGERVRRQGVASALAIVAVAGVGGAIVAPRVDQGTPWVDYRAWAGTLVRVHVDTFNWNQTYGPLRWPRSGHEVLTVRAAEPDYWKAEDLSSFNGYSWVAGSETIQPVLPVPSARARAQWTQTIRVSIQGMQTHNVIAAGYAAEPSTIAGGFGEGVDPGTWIAGNTLGPGASYEISTYSPHPSPAQLAGAGRDYPGPELGNDLTLGIPLANTRGGVDQVTFPVFHAHTQPAISNGVAFDEGATTVAAAVAQSPYGGAYALARRLAAQARTPYAFVSSVQRYLGAARGFSYNENPPVRRYPLESFLLSDRVGYCQQFSGTMAMLLRMGGIPARVAAGFTSGSRASSSHPWTVTDIDAHAWVEAWFPHYGWVRFDPTPASAPARGGDTALPIVKNLPGADSAQSAAPLRDIGAARAATTVAGHHGSGGPSLWLIALAVILLAGTTGLLSRTLRAASGTEDLLVELERALSRTRRPLKAGVTLAGLEQRLGGSTEAAAYVRALRMTRYGGDTRPPSAAQRRALRQELARGLGVIGRVRALWALPPRILGSRPPGGRPPTQARPHRPRRF
jgi:hypothetical protein